MNDVLERTNLRYFFEHQMLPDLFYRDGLKFTEKVTLDNRILFYMYDIGCRKYGIENPYTLEEFKVEKVQISENVRCIKVAMPAPEETPLCYNIYMFYHTDFSKAMYFTVEKGKFGNISFLCGWNNMQAHLNFGMYMNGDEAMLQYCESLYMEDAYYIDQKALSMALYQKIERRQKAHMG